MVYLAVQPKAVYMGKRQTMKFSFPISTQYVYVVYARVTCHSSGRSNTSINLYKCPEPQGASGYCRLATDTRKWVGMPVLAGSDRTGHVTYGGGVMCFAQHLISLMHTVPHTHR